MAMGNLPYMATVPVTLRMMVQLILRVPLTAQLVDLTSGAICILLALLGIIITTIADAEVP
jgi:hypothetical protein